MSSKGLIIDSFKDKDGDLKSIVALELDEDQEPVYSVYECCKVKVTAVHDWAIIKARLMAGREGYHAGSKGSRTA